MESQFVIGSISKQITAVLVLREYEKGNLKLDDRIIQHLPDIEQPLAKRMIRAARSKSQGEPPVPRGERPVLRGEWLLSQGKRPVPEFLQLNTTHRILVDFQLIPRT